MNHVDLNDAKAFASTLMVSHLQLHRALAVNASPYAEACGQALSRAPQRMVSTMALAMITTLFYSVLLVRDRERSNVFDAQTGVKLRVVAAARTLWR